jgi:hypothetical protein
MTTTLCRRENGLRTYYLADRPINVIVFYRDGEVVYHTRSSWIEGESYAHRDMPGLTLSTEVRRAAKLNLSKGGHFYLSTGKAHWAGDKTKVDVYVDLALGDCEFGEPVEVESYRTDSGIAYHTVRTMTALFGGDSRETITVVLPSSQHTVSNAYGEKLAAISQRLKALGADRNVSGIETLIKDRALLDLMFAAHELVAKN